MKNKEYFLLKLSEIRSMYTDKAPLAPCIKLDNLYSYLENEEERKVFLEVLKEKENDTFWSEYINIFLKENKITM